MMRAMIMGGRGCYEKGEERSRRWSHLHSLSVSVLVYHVRTALFGDLNELDMRSEVLLNCNLGSYRCVIFSLSMVAWGVFLLPGLERKL